MKNYIVTMLVFLFILSGVQAQIPEQLSLEQAIALSLANNQEIKIQQRQVDLAENERFPANAGLLPTLSLVGNANFQNNDTDAVIRTFTDFPPTLDISDGAAATTTYSAVVQLDYALLGGFSGKYRYQLLSDQRDMAYHQQQVVINQTILTVTELFLEIAKLQNQEELLVKSVAIGEQRLSRIEDQFSFGQITGMIVLKAKTDLNRDRSSLDQLLLSQNNLKRNLNYWIGIDAETDYRVTAAYTPPAPVSRKAIESAVLTGNPEIQLSKMGIQVAAHQYKLTTAQRMPTVNAFANYGYFNQSNDLQQLAEIRTLGYTVGIGLRYDLFTGGRTHRKIQSAKMSQEISQLRQTQTSERVLAEALKEHHNLVVLMDQLQRENQNINTFREGYTRTEERFFNGKASSIDLRDAQNALLNAEIILGNLQADIMKSSLRLEALKGTIVQNQNKM